MRTFFDAWKTLLPNIVQIGFPSEIEQFDTASGELEGSFAITAGATVQGTGGSAVFSSVVGACVNWKTDAVVNGRKLRGRTFMVPLQSLPSFDTTGSLGVAALITMRAAATALVNDTSGMPFVVWHRPSPGGTDGASGTVVAATVNDMTAVLRSRRD